MLCCVTFFVGIFLLQSSLGIKCCAGLPVYCVRISSAEYARQSVDDTESAIVELTNSMLDDTKLTLREKRRHLRHLARHHVDIYSRHFSDMI